MEPIDNKTAEAWGHLSLAQQLRTDADTIENPKLKQNDGIELRLRQAAEVVELLVRQLSYRIPEDSNSCEAYGTVFRKVDGK